MEAKRHSQAIAALARAQWGVISRPQLLALGASDHEVDGLRERGRLRAIHRNVYAIGGAVVPVHGRWLAAVLACEPDAVLSHFSAAGLWRILDPGDGPVHVTCVAQRKPRKGIRVHRTRSLDGDTTKRDRIPVTTPLRTVLDLERDGAQPRTLERALENAEVRHVHLPLDALHARCGAACASH